MGYILVGGICFAVGVFTGVIVMAVVSINRYRELEAEIYKLSKEDDLK